MSSWVQLGQDIGGEAPYDESGYSVSLNADGTRVAIGAPFNDGNGFNAGHVRVYQLDNNNWVKLGQDIDGEAPYDASGYSVSLNEDGTIVAIGSRYNDGNGVVEGHVRVYQLDNTSSSWVQLGEDIDGEADNDNSGYSVSLNADGTRVAIGSPFNDGAGSNSGHTRVYEWNSSNWVQLGEDIDGEAANDKSGWSVSLNADGTIVAIGAPINNGSAGHVRVYQLDNTNNWVQLGEDIDGEASGDQSGYSVSLNADGTRVAIGAPFNDGNGSSAGHVRVYQLDNNNWVKLGQDIDGEAANDQSGYSVSLNADGTIVAIGARYNDGNGVNAGSTRVYQWDNTNTLWVKLSQDIDGEASGDASGYSVSLNADGTRVAIGSVGNDGNGTNAGHVRVFTSIQNPNISPFTIEAKTYGDSPFPITQPVSNSDGAFTYTSDNEEVATIDGNLITIVGAGTALITANQASTDDYNSGSVQTTFTVNKATPDYYFWKQLGQDIDGEAAGDQSGRTVSLNADGTIVAIGAYLNDVNGADAGSTRVYQWNNTNTRWEQLGQDIDGEAAGDQSGYSVSLNADGTRVAIGARFNDGSSSLDERYGSTRVYQWNNTNTRWEQLGQDIDGEAPFDYSGFSVSLNSEDGTRVAIGARYNDGTGGTYRGSVRVYQLDNTNTWVQLGQDIDGEASGDQSGVSVSLNADGTIIAIGAPYNDGTGSGTDRGSVRVYQLDNTNIWVQLGQDIDGEASGDESGWSVSLNSDGTRVAIGARYNDGSGTDAGSTRVYQFNNTTNLWEQLGQDIDGEASGDRSGRSVSLNVDGTIVAIGAPYNDGSGSDAGHVRVYKFNNDTTNWVQLGQDIDGEAESDNSGFSVSLNADGTIVAIGAYDNDGNGSDAGHVRVYELATFTIPTKTYRDVPFTIEQPVSNSDGAFTYTSSNENVATIDGNLITIKGAGQTTITANQASTDDYNSGSVETTFTVNKANPSITGFSIPEKTYGDVPFTIEQPDSNSDGAFTYTSDNEEVATIDGNLITIKGAGQTTITANQLLTDDYNSGSVQTTFTVNKADPNIGSLTIEAKTYGDFPFTITQPTSDSDGAFTYTSSEEDVATIDGNIITIVGAGQTTITANQAETLNYNSGSVQTTFEVMESSPSNPVIITSGFELIYFINTGSTYGEITKNVVVNENLIASSKKVLYSNKNDLSITKTNLL